MTGYLLLFGSGLIAGALNVIAGGGSFLTLPLLMFLGLPAGMANGTNRVGIVLQNVAAVWSFERHRVLDWGSLWWAAAPATLGAALGTALANTAAAVYGLILLARGRLPIGFSTSR